MALSDLQKQGILRNLNLNPNEYEVDDTGAVGMKTPSAELDPIKFNAPTSGAQQDSPTATALKSFGVSAIPSIGAGLGAAGAIALAPATLGQSLWAIPIALGGGYAGGKLASMGQEAVLPDSIQQNVSESQALNPKSAVLGQVAAMPLGGFSPSISNLGKAAGTLGKMATGLERSADEVPNLLNVGVGAGLGAVQPMIEGDFNPEDIATSALTGAVFNKANAIGNKLGFHNPAETIATSPDKYKELLLRSNGTKEAPVADEEQRALFDLQQRLENAKSLASGDSKEVPLQRTKIPAGGTMPEQTVGWELPNQGEAAAPTVQATPTVNPEDAIKAQLLAQQAKLPTSTTYKNQEAAPVLTEGGRILQEQAQKMGYDVSQISPEMFSTWAREISAQHGLNDAAKPDINGNTKGTAFVGSDKTEINTALADAGTQPHENFHHIFDAMPEEAKASLVEQTKPAYEAYEAERQKAGLKPLTGGHEEFLATEMGYRTVSHLMNGANESSLGRWWKDTSSLFAAKYGAKPTVDQLYRSNIYKLINGLSEVKVKLGKTGLGGATAAVTGKNQDADEIPLNRTGREEEEYRRVMSEAKQKDEAKGWFDKMREAVSKDQPADEGLPKQDSVDEKTGLPSSFIDRILEYTLHPDDGLVMFHTHKQYTEIVEKLRTKYPRETAIAELKSIQHYEKENAVDIAAGRNKAYLKKPSLYQAIDDLMLSLSGKQERMIGLNAIQTDEARKTNPAGLRKVLDNLGAARAARNPQVKPAEKSKDKQDYDAVVKKMEGMEFGTPEFQAAWKEMEAIKNRNKGITPLNQPAKEGLIPGKTITYEQKREQQAMRRKANMHLPDVRYRDQIKADNEALRVEAGKGPREAGRSPLTYPNDEKQVASILAAPRRRTPVELTDQDATRIQNIVNRKIGRLAALTGTHDLVDSHVREELQQQVLTDILKDGVDNKLGREYRRGKDIEGRGQEDESVDSWETDVAPTQQQLLEATANRRTHQYFAERYKQWKKDGKLVSLDAEMGKEKDNTLHSAIADNKEQAPNMGEGGQESPDLVEKTKEKTVTIQEKKEDLTKNADTSAEDLAGSLEGRLMDIRDALDEGTINKTPEIESAMAKLQTAIDHLTKLSVREEGAEVNRMAVLKHFDLLPKGKNQDANEGLRRKQTDTPEFKEWFGDSKVVDKDGKPLVVYHGTTSGKDFDTFKHWQRKDGKGAETMGEGFYFSPDSEIASNYATKYAGPDDTVVGAGHVYPVYLSLKNPASLADLQRIFKHHDFSFPGGLPEGREMTRKLESLGYDGISTEKEIVAFHPEQIKSATGNNGEFSKTDPRITHQDVKEGIQRNSFVKPLEATFDRVEKHSPELAQAFRNWAARRDEYLGKRNVALDALDKYDRKDVTRVTAKMREAFRDPARPEPLKLQGKEGEIYKILSDYYSWNVDSRRAMGMEISNRKAGKNPNYVPDVMSPQAIDLFTKRPTSPEAKRLKNEWQQYILSKDSDLKPVDVAKDIHDYINALGADKNNYLSVNFGAVRRAEGFGLPESLREKDGVLALERYGRRAAADIAMFKELQSKPAIAELLGIRNEKGKMPENHEASLAAVPEVKDSMKWVTDNFATNALSSQRANAVVHLVNNMLLGPATGLRDTASVPLNMIPYITSFKDLKAAMVGIAAFRDTSRKALEMAARQPNMDKLMFDQIKDQPDAFASVLRKAATFARKWQGREALENFNRDITFGAGRELGRQWILGAKAGNKKAALMLKKFDTLLPENYLETTGVEHEKVLDQIGKNFTDRNQGTYGGTGLPVGLVESQFAPFMSMQKWSVEKSNVIYKDVIKPALTGENYTPLITYSVGAFLTGAGIQELNQLLTNRKSADPTISEALAGRPIDKVAELATIMQLASLGGIVGDTLKFASDVGIYGKTPRNVVGFPTASAAVDMQERTKDMLEALREGEPKWEVLKQYFTDLATHNIQAVRMVGAYTINDEKGERQDKFRDLRVFKQLEGEPAQTYAAPNPYLNIDAKKFKQTSDMGVASSEVPAMLQEAIAKGNGNPEKIKEKVASLKQNSYQTMPSPQGMPLEFNRYYQYLAKTQGAEVANQRLQDYLRQSQVNKAKSGMIPSL